MAIQDLLKSFGQRLGSGLTQVGGYDPMQQVSPEEAARRRLEGLSALQREVWVSLLLYCLEILEEYN
jgi:hypothetical protein